MIFPPVGYEQKALETARRALDDIPECRAAEYKLRWNLGTNPVIVIAFSGQTVQALTLLNATPAVAVGLRLRKRGSPLVEFAADAPLLEGARLRDHVLHSVHHYLDKHGIRVSLDADEGEQFART